MQGHDLHRATKCKTVLHMATRRRFTTKPPRLVREGQGTDSRHTFPMVNRRLSKNIMTPRNVKSKPPTVKPKPISRNGKPHFQTRCGEEQTSDHNDESGMGMPTTWEKRIILFVSLICIPSNIFHQLRRGTRQHNPYVRGKAIGDILVW